MSIIAVERYHDFSAAHRDYMDPGKCGRIHGHNYRIYFKIAQKNGGLSKRGYAGASFEQIKDKLCQWLEENWDHQLLLSSDDPVAKTIKRFRDGADFDEHSVEAIRLLASSAVLLGFNPTTEALAKHLLHVVGPRQLKGLDAMLISVKVEETRKCSAQAVTTAILRGEVAPGIGEPE